MILTFDEDLAGMKGPIETMRTHTHLFVALGFIVPGESPAQQQIDSLHIYSESFFADHTIALFENNAINEFSMESFSRPTADRELDMLADVMANPQLIPSTCNGPCQDVRMVCLFYKACAIDTVSFSVPMVMAYNGKRFDYDLDLFEAIACILHDKEIRESMLAKLPGKARCGRRCRTRK